MHKSRGRFFVKRPVIAAAATGLVAAAGLLSALGPGTSSASSHREAPLIAGDPQADNTDVYAFTSPDKPDTVTLVANWIPFEEPNGGPNFYPFADGHPLQHQDRQRRRRRTPDLTYRWTFRNEDRRGNEHVPVQQRARHLAGRPDPAVPSALHAAGASPAARRRRRSSGRRSPPRPTSARASMPNYSALREPGDRARSPAAAGPFAGQADDPFFLDLRVFDLLYGGEPEGDRARHARRLQRQHHRPAGAQDARSPTGATPPATRSSASGAPPTAGGADVTAGHGRRPARTAGVPSGQPAGQRGRVAGRPEGRLQHLPPAAGPHRPSRWSNRCSTPSCPR